SESIAKKVNFWADLNRDVFQFALESGMKANQYIAIRIEDLVAGHEPCFRRLAHYLNLSPEELEVKVPASIKANQGHEGSYFGNEWNKNMKNMVETGVKHDSYVLPQFDFWGYQPDEYKLTKDCESLEWMKLMREREGPLPGDDDPKL